MMPRILPISEYTGEPYDPEWGTVIQKNSPMWGYSFAEVANALTAAFGRYKAEPYHPIMKERPDPFQPPGNDIWFCGKCCMPLDKCTCIKPQYESFLLNAGYEAELRCEVK